MNGTLLPAEAWALVPAWRNPLDNTALVQFVHRWLAIATVLVVLALALRARLLPGHRVLATGLGLVALVQVGLGIATLLLAVPIVVATLHQVGALTLFGLLVGLQWRLAH